MMVVVAVSSLARDVRDSTTAQLHAHQHQLLIHRSHASLCSLLAEIS